MKKVLALIAIVGFVACNNAETKDNTADSLRRVDSLRKEDSIKAATQAAMDTSKKAMDTAKAAKAGVDTLKKAH
jgi:hypothetical protein